MSKTIDQRVVEMRFDNKQFENNVKTSLSTLDKLKQSLRLDGAAKGFEEVDSAARKLDMSGLGSAVESVKSRFSALEVMAVTALANITNSVINTGKQMLESLTIEPIKQGFDEYELKMGSIQTIMMSTGASLEEVNGYLNELNTYADRTIYSFADMTSNIGKFTNAGVSLKDAVMAIQGVSNEAAVSGANAQEASRAMYNFAQALSAGYVKLIDWKSIENANMATVEFKTQLLESAVACGTVKKTADGMYQVLTSNGAGKKLNETIDATHNFNDSLAYQWMTTEALVSTLRDYADETTEIGKKAFAAAQDVKTFTQLMDTLQEAVGSGWAMTWEILFGDFEEAKKLWTSLSNVIGGFIDAQSSARNDMLQTWKDLGGRTDLIEAAANAFKGLQSVITPVAEAFREIFPALTGEQLYNFTVKLKELTEKFKMSEETSENLKNTFKGLFAVLDIVKQALSAVLQLVGPLLGIAGKANGGILAVTGSIGKWLTGVDEAIKRNDLFKRAVQGVIDVVKKVCGHLQAFWKMVRQKLNLPGFDAVKAKIQELYEKAPSLGEIFGKIQPYVSRAMAAFRDLSPMETFGKLLDHIRNGMDKAGEAASSMKEKIGSAMGSLGETIKNSKVVQFLGTLWEAVKRVAQAVGTVLADAFGNLTEKLKRVEVSDIINLLKGLSIGGIALGIKKFVDLLKQPFDDVGSIKESVVGILDSVKGCFEAWQTSIKADVLMKIAKAIAILTASILVLSMIDSEKLDASLGAMILLFGELMGSMAIFTKVVKKSSDIQKSSTLMIAMSVSLLILAGALKKISSLNMEELGIGLVGVGALLLMMTESMKALTKQSASVAKGAATVLQFVVVIRVLTTVCKQLAAMNWGELTVGLTGVGVLLTELSLFLNGTDFQKFGKNGLSAGVGLVFFGVAIRIFTASVRSLSEMEPEKLALGLAGMAGMLLMVSVSLKQMPKNLPAIGIGLTIVSAALAILAGVLRIMGGMEIDQVATGLAVLGGSLAILVIGLNAMQGTLAGSAAMLVAAVALAMITPLLLILGQMSWEAIAKGLTAIAGTFLVFGVAGLVLGPIVPVILSLAAAIALMTVSLLAVGASLLLAGSGIAALATGLTALAAIGAAGAAAIVGALSLVVLALAQLLPQIAIKLAEGIVDFMKVLGQSAAPIGAALKELIFELLDVLIECIPPIVDGALLLVDEILKAIVRYTPSVVDSIFQFLVAVLEGVAANLPSLIQAGIDVIMAFFTGVVEAFKSIDTDILMEGIVGVGILSAVMAALTAVALLVPGAMIGVLGMGAVIAELALVLAAVGAISLLPGLHWLIGKGGDLLQAVGTAIGKFAGGIAGGFASGVSASFIDIADDLSEFMARVQPFLEGAAAIDPAMLDGIKALTEAILLLTAANLIDSLASWFTGGVSLADFADQLVPFGQAMKAFSDEVTGIDGEAITKASDAGKTLAEMADMLPKSGGLVGWFAGETDMEKFGQQLVLFGRSMREYSYAVAGLRVEAIQSSAAAGEALAELAGTLPNTGGLVSWFTGEQDLAVFGQRLVPFGRSMREYSAAVAGLNGNVVTNSANAAKALVELASNLPSSGGIISWFTGESDMEAFGRQLVSFGEALFAYYNKVSWIDTVKLKDTTEEFRGLMRLFDEIGDLRTNGVSQFSRSLTVLAETGIENFVGAFADAESKIEAAGQSMVQFFKTGADSKKEEMKQSFVTLAGEALSSLRSKLTEFTASGEAFIANLILGAKGKLLSLKEAFGALTDACVRLIREKRPSFYSAGEYLVKGFAQGIDETRWEAEAKAKGMAKAAAQAAAEELQIHSPSKVGYRIGGFFGLGFIKSLADYSERSYDAGASVAASAKNGLRETIARIGEFIDSGMDTQPTIRPVLDLSSVQRSSGQLSALLSGNRAMAINAAVEEERTRNIQNGESKSASSNSYSFVQNNYSPKPLSRIEIYRQTKNQFSALKGLVEV